MPSAIQEQLDILQREYVSTAEAQDAASEAERRIVALIDETRTQLSQAEVPLEEVKEKARAILKATIATRDSLRTVVMTAEGQNRSLMDAEQTLIKYLRRKAEEGQPEAEDALKGFGEDRRATRYAENATLRELNDWLLKLQQHLSESFRVRREGHLQPVQQSEELQDLVSKSVIAAADRGAQISEEDVRNYLFRDSRSARAALAAALEATERRKQILSFLDDAHANLFRFEQYFSEIRSDHLGIVMVKAATPSKADLPETRWLESLREQAKGKMVDFATDTGTAGVFYVSEEGTFTKLEVRLPSSYGDLSLEDALAAEADPDDVRHATSAPLRAHLYDEKEMKRALESTPDGARIKVKMCVGDRMEEVLLTKHEGQLAYTAEMPGTAPDPQELAAHPGKYIDQRTLFIDRDEDEGGAGA
ncbi:MAG: hypothetical protein WCV62_00720 [Candidatus Peribacteraceae bacterium]|jgi:hypothetical protein